MNFKDYQIVGIVDSDGGFSLRLLTRMNNKLGVSPCVQIVQKTENEQVLLYIQKRLGSKVKMLHQIDDEGHACSVLNVFLTTPPGKVLLDILHRCPSFCPGKRRDYQIALKLIDYSLNNYWLSEVKNKPWAGDVKEKVSAVAVATLVYYTSHELYGAIGSRKKSKSAADWVNYLKPTLVEKQQGIALAEKILEKIQQEENAFKEYCMSKKANIPKSYIVGFHIGDGCLGVSLSFNNKSRGGYYVCPYWYLTESPSNVALLEAIKTTLKHGRITHDKKGGKVFLRIEGFVTCAAVVAPLLDGAYLPDFRMLQFRKFTQACLLGEQGIHRSFFGFQRLLEICYNMSRDGALRRSTKEELLAQAEAYFSKPNRLIYANTVSRYRKLRNDRIASIGVSKKSLEEQQKTWIRKFEKKQIVSKKNSLFQNLHF